jgi:phosphoadenosine phosphosulfate reductase
MDIEQINLDLADKSPEDIIQWALANSSNPLVTTNFRPYESAILHATCKLKKDLKVVWCDTGYNTPDTYRHAKELIGLLEMNMHVYVPKYSAGFRDVLMGIPEIDTDAHNTFTEQVKLEPFRRAIEEHKPDLWFTNLRKGQTAFRNSIDIVSIGKDGTIKVSPFYHYSDVELDEYLALHNLPNEFNYFDPTKQLASRECGLHN